MGIMVAGRMLVLGIDGGKEKVALKLDGQLSGEKVYLKETFIIVDAVFAIGPRLTDDFSTLNQLETLNLILNEFAFHGNTVHSLHLRGATRCMDLAAEISLPDNLSGGDVDKRFMKIGGVLEVEVCVDDPRRRTGGSSGMFSFKETMHM
jgi:hypothetical protein